MIVYVKASGVWHHAREVLERRAILKCSGEAVRITESRPGPPVRGRSDFVKTGDELWPPPEVCRECEALG